MEPEKALSFLVQICGKCTNLPLETWGEVHKAAQIITDALKPKETPPTE